MIRTIMPTYEYQCPEGHMFEKFQKMSDKPRAHCPVCGKPATRKISGGAGLVFKGSGFYITDYGKDGKGPRKETTEKAEKPDKSEKSEKVEKTESTKPAAESSKKADAGTSKTSPGKGKASPE
jgi:putative FmdB family regulatory protein